MMIYSLRRFTLVMLHWNWRQGMVMVGGRIPLARTIGA
jgi:hypothetical protein